MIIFSILAPLAQNKVTFFVVRSLLGLSMGVTGPISLTQSAEMVMSSHREIGPLCISVSFCLGPFVVALFAYFLLNMVGWRWFIVTQTVVPLIVCLILVICFLPESPRYLVVSGREEEALETLQRVAKKNGKSLPQRLNIVVPEHQNLGSISDILRSDFRKETVLLSIMYFGDLVINYGAIVFLPLALYSGFCGGEVTGPPLDECETIQPDELLQLSIVTSASIPAIGLAYFALVILGRSVILKICNTIRLVLILLLFKCFSQLTTFVLFFLIFLFQVSAGVIKTIIIPELYPTIFRNTATAFIVSWGKLGSVVGAGSVYVLYDINPLLVVGLFSLCAVLVAVASWIWNKETKDVVIRDVRDNIDKNDNECD